MRAEKRDFFEKLLGAFRWGVPIGKGALNFHPSLPLLPSLP
jgi:hypothetical protein